MMISALKMTADRMALSGVESRDDVHLVELGVHADEHRRDDGEVLRDVRWRC